ncbi:hypothetical protein [Lapidilactobacillus bayanensis]|uniref:hypothetical protein n=1 Tax=Lapidilactobacillus bayanensis TaxID=2485998 RepID=UPI000F77E910|nr:hypothetical protein [Lapidilactobacillus bayanensis]
METSKLWQYQVRNLGRTFSFYIAIMTGITIFLTVTLMIAFHWQATAIVSWFSATFQVMFVFSLVLLSFQLVSNWRYLLEFGYSRRHLYRQGWQLVLLFSLGWTLLVFAGSLIPGVNQLLIFRLFSFGDYQSWFSINALNLLVICLLNSALIGLIIEVASLLAILQVEFQKKLFLSVLILIYALGATIFILPNAGINSVVVQRVTAVLLGYNASGPDDPLRLLLTTVVIGGVIWFANWKLWLGYESRKIS